MKFALYEFCEDNSCAVGESNWMVSENESSFNNNDWVTKKEVLVRWPKAPKDYLKWSNKNGKSPLDSECNTKTYTARVLKFHDEYDSIRRLMTTYLNTGTTQTPSRGRGQRKAKRNERYLDTEDEEEVEAPTKKQPTKKHKSMKKKVTNSEVSKQYIEMLKQKFAEKKQLPDAAEHNYAGSSDESDNDFESDLSDVNNDNANEKKKLAAKDKELDSLRKQIRDMQNLEDVVMQLKDSVGRLNKLAALGCKCQQQKMNISKTVETSKRPSSPISITSNRSSSSDVDSEPDRILICPNIEISKAQKKVLCGKHSAKDFVYTILPMIWSRQVLCTHSVTGRQSNAHKDREAKPQLDAEKVDSLCNYVSQKFGDTNPKEVRRLMTTKINNLIKCSKQKVGEQKVE